MVCVAEAPAIAGELRQRVLGWEREEGLPHSFDGEEFRVFPGAPRPASGPRGVSLNEGTWADNLPADERPGVETFAEAFTRAVAKETTLSPGKLSLTDYKRKGGPPLTDTPWEEAWREEWGGKKQEKRPLEGAWRRQKGVLGILRPLVEASSPLVPADALVGPAGAPGAGRRPPYGDI